MEVVQISVLLNFQTVIVAFEALVLRGTTPLVTPERQHTHGDEDKVNN
jgi:hypothetical protein